MGGRGRWEKGSSESVSGRIVSEGDRLDPPVHIRVGHVCEIRRARRGWVDWEVSVSEHKEDIDWEGP